MARPQIISHMLSPQGLLLALLLLFLPQLVAQAALAKLHLEVQTIT
jgi:hypothetical protein